MPCSVQRLAARTDSACKLRRNVILPVSRVLPSPPPPIPVPRLQTWNHTHHTLHMPTQRTGMRPLGLTFQAHQGKKPKTIYKTTTTQKRSTSPEPLNGNGQRWKQALCLLNLQPLYLITLEVHKHNSTFLRGTAQAWDKVIDFPESFVQQCVCISVCTYGSNNSCIK